MTELDLYNFLRGNNIEMRWDGDVLSTWLSHYEINELTNLIGDGPLEDGGIKCNLREHGVLYLDLVPVCNYFDIDPERIYPKPEE